MPTAAARTALCLLFVAAGPGRATEPLRPYLAPWVVVGAGDSRLQALTTLPEAPVNVNAPGLLLEVPHDSIGDPAVAGAARTLVALAPRAGWHAGISVALHAEPEPMDLQSAEAANAETLFPGLGKLLAAANGASLFVLSFPDLGPDPRPYRFVVSKLASEIRAANPAARVVPLLATPPGTEGFPTLAASIFTDEVVPYIDGVGLLPGGAPIRPGHLRQGSGDRAEALPLLVRAGPQPNADALIALAARLAEEGAPFVAAPLLSPASEDASLARLGRVLAGDFGHDGRSVTARTRDGRVLPAHRFVARDDLGGLVVVPAVDAEGKPVRAEVLLSLDGPDYSAAEVTELATGRSRRFDIPRRKDPLVLTLSTVNGPLAVKLTALEKAPAEATKASVGVTAQRGITVEEILARHQVWRAGRDARWSRLAARNLTSLRVRLVDLNSTFDVSFAGPFFYQPGKGSDWVWQESFVNGVRWRGKKIPEFPLIQPEKVAEVPLTLTFNDAYRYTLVGEETIGGILCHAIDFEPKERPKTGSLHEGRVFISASDYAVIRTKTRQLNLTGDIQSVDETTEFGEVSAPDGGAPIRLPLHTRGQWILKTFSRTTVLERETVLSGVRLDPPDWDAMKKAAEESDKVMLRDTEQGLRYLEKDKSGRRVVTQDPKTSRLFGLGGLFYDSSLDYPLPLLGVYYLDLDVAKQKRQLQVFFGGVLLAGSYSDPNLLGTGIELGADVFGIAFRGTDKVLVDGEEQKGQRVKQLSFAGNLNFGYSISRHLKLTASLGASRRDFSEDTETSPDFVIPSDHWLTRLELRATWDLGGYAVSGRYGWNRRSSWDPWGYPGNPDYDAGKDRFETWSVGLAKDFHLPRFQRVRTSATYVGSENTDRFSRYTFGSFGGSSLIGFAGGSLRAESAVTLHGAYGYVFGDAFRLEGIYDHAFVKDPAAGLDWASFGGAGVSGQLPGPWSTIVQIGAGLPVVGRRRGQTGFVLNLVFLKIF